MRTEVEIELRDAVGAFARKIAGIVDREVAAAVRGARQHVQEVINSIVRGGANGTAPVKSPAEPTVGRSVRSRRRRVVAREGYDRLVPRLVELIQAHGETLQPNVLSRELRLSPFQRRALVNTGVQQKLIRVTGVRRGTLYKLGPRAASLCGNPKLRGRRTSGNGAAATS